MPLFKVTFTVVHGTFFKRTTKLSQIIESDNLETAYKEANAVQEDSKNMIFSDLTSLTEEIKNL